LHEPVDIGGFPFELTVGMIGGSDVWVKKELAGVSEGPIFWYDKLGFSCLYGGDEVFKGAIFADEFESSVRADFWDRVEVITA